MNSDNERRLQEECDKLRTKIAKKNAHTKKVNAYYKEWQDNCIEKENALEDRDVALAKNHSLLTKAIALRDNVEQERDFAQARAKRDLVDSGHVSAINLENGFSKTSLAHQNGVSESPEDGLANEISKDTLYEAVVVDSSAKQSDEVSFVSIFVFDSNRGSFVDQNEASKWPKDGLANGISKHTILEAVVVDSSAK
ncbi:hypothetical protein REPUB_Repub18cG0018300 [Reevesia pubescens]